MQNYTLENAGPRGVSSHAKEGNSSICSDSVFGVFRSSSGISSPRITNFRGWRRVWGEPGENRWGSGGEPGAPKRTGGETGAFGKRTGGEPGASGIHLQRVLGEKRGLWDKNRGRTRGGGNFL